MAHYWIPALWRYARATNDPRMPKVFDRYFKACLAADPFQADVGVYSNTHIGYAYAFSKDPRHLRAAVAELDELRPHAEPLAKPEDLGQRLYNPYAPIRSFTGVPRLVWALEEAKRTWRDGSAARDHCTRSVHRSPGRRRPIRKHASSFWGFDACLGCAWSRRQACPRPDAYNGTLQSPPCSRSTEPCPVSRFTSIKSSCRNRRRRAGTRVLPAAEDGDHGVAGRRGGLVPRGAPVVDSSRRALALEDSGQDCGAADRNRSAAKSARRCCGRSPVTAKMSADRVGRSRLALKMLAVCLQLRE